MNSRYLEGGLGIVPDEVKIHMARNLGPELYAMLDMLDQAQQVAGDAAVVLSIAEQASMRREHAEPGEELPLGAYGEGALRRLAVNALSSSGSLICEWLTDYVSRHLNEAEDQRHGAD